ncbi:TPA: D-hexose-6-phosphate mutarotase [Pasteurella multocida]|nr:D-hexose-6-phosphate mutarotase [Pasteurella multocida]
MHIQHIKQITPELNLYHYNQIPVVELKHAVGQAKIALQGAQLLQWQPKGERELLWLSEIEPFELGVAIRGGVPLCYPWFGNKKQPIHGTARLQLWSLSDYAIAEDKVRLVFALFNELNCIEAKVAMTFTQDCQIEFTHYGETPAQAALHTYFNVSDIAQVEVNNLPQTGLNAITQQIETLPATRKITENVDCVYALPSVQNYTNSIVDLGYTRQIVLEHQQISDLVLWNPWHNAVSAMQEKDYKQMLCLESARIAQPLLAGEQIAVKISTNKIR